jgi:non-specific protein-tyrosine kinase
MSMLRKAMDKAKQDRASQEMVRAEVALTAAPVSNTDSDFDIDEMVSDPVRQNLTYSATRVMDIEPEKLIESKVLSLFHSGQVSDQIKLLRTQLLNHFALTGSNTLLITSAGPREGKTFTAMNLAVSISHDLTRTVLLVDADIRKPSIHEYFHLGSPPGLTDYLLGASEIPDLLVNPGIPKLTLLPAGNRLDNSTELLGSPRMKSLVGEMKARYPDRFILFDSPSLLSSADALTFSQYVDGILLVVEAEHTQRKDLTRALNLLRGRPVLGVVFNKARGKH